MLSSLAPDHAFPARHRRPTDIIAALLSAEMRDTNPGSLTGGLLTCDLDRPNNEAMASLEGLTTNTNAGQCAAAHATTRLLDETIELRFFPTPGEDELWVVMPETRLPLDLRSGEQVLSQLLGRKVWITQDNGRYQESLPFPAGAP